MKLTDTDYRALHSIVFQPDYPGYRPNVVESPNGDGKWDREKRYAHIAEKYLDLMPPSYAKTFLFSVLFDAVVEAAVLWPDFGGTSVFHPHYNYSALRILDYPPGATSAPHTDFDLFTLMLYRDQPEKFRYLDGTEPPEAAQKLSPHIHFGELYEELGLGKATKHEVVASDVPQHSIVFFAIPDHAAVLPSGLTVGQWLTERMARSRGYK